MENKRLILAILLSTVIMVGFQVLMPASKPHPADQAAQAAMSQQVPTKDTPSSETPKAQNPLAFPGNRPEAEPVPQNVPRVKIDAPRVQGSVSLLGARIDDLVMRDYHQTSDPHSPNWPLLIPRANDQPTYVQFGWTADQPNVALPGNGTVWTADSEGALTPDHPVTLSWNNGAGLLFQIALTIDRNYMFGVTQSVRNSGADAVVLHPWSRVRRDYRPVEIGRVFLHEGPTGVMNGRLQEMSYEQTRKDAGQPQKAGQAAQPGVAFSAQGSGGWAGIADKYMLTALVPDQAQPASVAYRYLPQGGSDRYQVDMIGDTAQTVAPGAEITTALHVFAGAMEIRQLDAYERQFNIPSFDKAIDFGRMYLLTKPILYALTWLNGLIGRFAITLLTFTVLVKLLFFPLTNYSFRSMRKMSLLGPKMTQIKERYKDDPAKMQQELGAVFKTEGVNPVSGCLPILLQAPVFIALYNVIYIDIDIWHAPFVGWIHDMSEADPTNLFNLFGLLPFNPAQYLSYLDLGLWPLILGGTMYVQQMFNPPPADPAQARMFKFMPVIFTFFFARLPAGLVIYYAWSNVLTVAQQWLMKRSVTLNKPGLARG